MRCLEHSLFFDRLHVVLINHSRRIEVLRFISIIGSQTRDHSHYCRNILQRGRKESHNEEVLVEDGLEETREKVFIERHIISVFEGVHGIKAGPSSNLNGWSEVRVQQGNTLVFLHVFKFENDLEVFHLSCSILE